MIAQEDDARLMWVVTVPAIWSNFGKRFMRAASHRAGLIADENDMQGLKLCLEPEAACLAVESSNQGVGSWHPGDKVGIVSYRTCMVGLPYLYSKIHGGGRGRGRGGGTGGEKYGKPAWLVLIAVRPAFEKTPSFFCSQHP